MNGQLTKEEAQKDLRKFADKKKETDKKAAEARGAASASSTEKAKTKEELETERKNQLAQEEAKAQAKKEDERVLAAKEGELNENDTLRRAALLKKKQDALDAKAKEQAEEDKRILAAKEEELNEGQMKRKEHLLREDVEKKKQAKLDARFGELTGKIKDFERDKEANKAELEQLRKEKDELAAIVNPPKAESEVGKITKETLSKYLEEDKDKPREQRREMTKDELEDWFLEEPVAANEWIVDRSLRRTDERKGIATKITTDNFAKKQKESFDRVTAKHPTLDIGKLKERLEVLEGEKKTKKEINTILAEEFPDMVLTYQVADEHPEWENEESGPELVMKEVEKRKANPPKPKEKEDESTKLKEANETIEKLKQEKEDLELELEKEENNDIGMNSNTARSRQNEKDKELSKQEKLLVATMRSKGASKESIEKALKKFRDKKGR